MVQSNDRRSSRSASSGESTASEVRAGAAVGTPRPRDVSKGARTLSEYFHEDKQRREVLRGEFLNLIAMLEYQRKYSRWYWRIWRFLMGDPQVSAIIPALVKAHEKTLMDARAILLQKAEEAAARIAAEKKALEVADAEAAKNAD